MGPDGKSSNGLREPPGALPQVIGAPEEEEEEYSDECDDEFWTLKPKPASAAAERDGRAGNKVAPEPEEEENQQDEGCDSGDKLLESEGPSGGKAEDNAQAAEKDDSVKITRMAAVTNLVTCMIGASVLSLPHVVARVGWVLGPACLALAGFVSCQGCLLVDRAIDAVFQLEGVRPRNIGDVVEVLFGPRGKTVVINMTCLFQVCKCGVYLLVIGTNLHFWLTSVSRRQSTLCATLICLRLVFLRDITVISRWSVIGVVASVFYFVTIAAGGFQAAAILDPADRPSGLWPLRVSEVPAMFSVMLYAYSPADVLPVLKSDMKNPNQLPSAVCWAHLTVVTLYVGLGAAGYFGWGRRVAGNVLESMCDFPGCPGAIPKGAVPGAKWSVGYILSFAVVANLMVTVPLVMYCVFRVMESQHEKLLASRTVNGAMRIAALLVSVSLAVFVPFFIEVLSLISTAILVTLQIFLPVSLSWALYRRGSVKFGATEAFLFLLGLCVFSVGMTGALRNLAEAVARERAH